MRRETLAQFKALSAELPSTISTSTWYWWTTTGRHVANMLYEAQYPEEGQRAFLLFYRDEICPRFGPPPDENSVRSALTWDGSPLEYSFGFAGAAERPTVRLSVDLSSLHPTSDTKFLDVLATHELAKKLAMRNSDVNVVWYDRLKNYLDTSAYPPAETKQLIALAGHQSPQMIGFDIFRSTRDYNTLSPPVPVRGKVYFLPCLAAAAWGVTRWQVVSAAIRQLPDVATQQPNILCGLRIIESYLATKPAAWENNARFLATDLLDPNVARLKIYIGCPRTSFNDMWDLLTLGGRISGLEKDKNRIYELHRLIVSQSVELNGDGSVSATDRYQKPPVCYFALSAQDEIPVPKLYIPAAIAGGNDRAIAKALDAWFQFQGWAGSDSTTYQNMVENSIMHRSLDSGNGIHSFITISQKTELQPGSRTLTVEPYLTPELYVPFLAQYDK